MLSSTHKIIFRRKSLTSLEWYYALRYPLNAFSSHANKKQVTSDILFNKERISSENIAKYKYLYEHIDKEGKGIKVCDFVEVVRELGLTATEEEIEKLFKRMNLESYGVMNETEFIHFITNIKDTSFTKLHMEAHSSDKTDVTKESWWSQKLSAAKAEWVHYKRGFKLLYDRLKFASHRTFDILGGRPLSRYESRKVFRAAKDFLILIPVATMAMLPGGSILVAFLVKYFPQLLPSTFRVENLTRQRKHELVITQVTAGIEEMELRLNKEKSEWAKSDLSYDHLLNYIAKSYHTSPSLITFLYGKDLNFNDINTNLKASGIIARLDDHWLQLLCQASMSNTGAGSYDPRSIRNSPLPVLRSLLLRRMRQIAANNSKVNSDSERLTADKLVILSEDPESLNKLFKARCFPASLTPEECRVWLQLESSLNVLLAFMFQLRDQYYTKSGVATESSDEISMK